MAVPGDSLSAEDIVAQVDRILSSAELGRSERLKKFLKFAVFETLEGRDGQLKEYTIAIEAFDRDESFDPQTSNIVRVEAGRLRQRLDAYYNGSGKYDPIRIVLPKGTYVPEIAPLVEDADNSPGGETNSATDSDDPAIVAPYGPSIAVLPFDNMSGDPDQDYFADGITEEIITDLSRFRDLFVIARNTTFQYRGQAVNIRAIGKELGVEYVLEGSIRTAGDNVRVTAQLIDAESGTHVWADTFDRTLSPQNLLAVQDELSNQVVARIAQPYGILRKVADTAEKRRAASDLRAYEAVLLFYAYWARHNPEDHLQARNALQNATEIDPNYADAWGALALVTVDEARFGFNLVPDEGDAWERAEAHARHALNLEPGCTVALQALVSIYFHQKKTAEFKSVAEKALSANPNHTDMLADFGVCLAYSGDWDRGLALVDKAMALSPRHPPWYHFAPAVNHFRQGAYEKALVHALEAELPEFYWAYALQAAVYGKLDRPEEGEAAVTRLLDVHPDFKEVVWPELRGWFYAEDIIRDLIDGMRRAGLAVPDEG